MSEAVAPRDPDAADLSFVVHERGYWRLVWRALREDKVAAAAGIVLLFIVFSCFVGGPIASRVLGHGPNQQFYYGAQFSTTSGQLTPATPWTWVPTQLDAYPAPTKHSARTLFIMGADGSLGRDEFVRLLYGGRTSLEIGVGATLLALLIGTTIGLIAGYFGGLTDVIASRTTEFVAAFPFLLLVIAIGWTIGERLNGIHWGMFPEGVLSLVVVIGAFTWPYPARIVRAQMITLRDQEFVDAARVCGASNRRIIFKHLLPHLAGTLIVYSTLILATNIVLESALSILNVGLQPQEASWGTMLAQNWGTLVANVQNGGAVAANGNDWTQAFPAGTLLITILCLSLFGEALREAADPRSRSVRR